MLSDITSSKMNYKQQTNKTLSEGQTPGKFVFFFKNGKIGKWTVDANIWFSNNSGVFTVILCCGQPLDIPPL